MNSYARPRISVAVPTARRPEYLKACLDSILAQTMPPAEIVVSDDGDDRETGLVVSALRRQTTLIRYVRNRHPLGQLRNRQQAFQLTSGNLVAMLDDDDVWDEAFLELTSCALESAPECGFCSTDHYVIDSGGQILVDESKALSQRTGRASMISGIYRDVFARELKTHPFSLQFTLFRRQPLEAVGFFPAYSQTVPDLALFLALGAQGIPGFFIQNRTGKYRAHPEQQTAKRTEQAASLVDCLVGIERRYSLHADEKRLLAKAYRAALVELAIARSHDRERRASLAALIHYGALGWGPPRPRRLVVLVALLLGVRRGAGSC
jgi:glycosyltransferase involved in cell wall biosynthesis